MSFKEKVTSSDVKVLGHIYLVAMLLLIGLALFYVQGIFV